MDNSSATHDAQQKDFISFFQSDPQQLSFNGQPQGPPMSSPNAQLNMELLGNLIDMQNADIQQSISQQPSFASPQALLERQFRLSQLRHLQQLQNQIFQQQIALISGQPGVNVPETSMTEPPREQHLQYHGLPTPGSSTELRPQPSSDYVSPMILHYMDSPQGPYHSNPMDTIAPHQQTYHGSSSAPANIAFNNNPSLALPSPAELDIDISPLTSPWLGAYQQSVSVLRPPSNKRMASPHEDESGSRKKLSPAIRPTNPAPKKPTRSSRSVNSTPLLRSSRKNSNVADGDTPSPVDLSMPPPAPPVPVLSSPNPNLTPVTPASIMNLGRLGLTGGLTSPTEGTKNSSKGKAPVRPKVSTDSKKSTRRNSSATSPGLKPILPAGEAPSKAGPSAIQGQPILQVRKTSHKAAEQKRRDSLKTTFDELRVLLPPVPLPSDENFPDERILPGALPPRGPPKAGAEGPNKGVSKLQLLMCGNDYIRQLKGRVERRDEEIEKLRQEVSRLRGLAGDVAGEIQVDLTRDLDDVEITGTFGSRRESSIPEDDEGEEE